MVGHLPALRRNALGLAGDRATAGTHFIGTPSLQALADRDFVIASLSRAL
jgi:hypothetical protein